MIVDWFHSHHYSLLSAVAACWVRKHELSTLASPPDMHRMAMSAHTEDSFYHGALIQHAKISTVLPCGCREIEHHCVSHLVACKDLLERLEGA